MTDDLHLESIMSIMATHMVRYRTHRVATNHFTILNDKKKHPRTGCCGKETGWPWGRPLIFGFTNRMNRWAT